MPLEEGTGMPPVYTLPPSIPPFSAGASGMFPPDVLQGLIQGMQQPLGQPQGETGGGGGALLPGFSDMGEQQAWMAAYLREHGGVPPSDWPQAARERQASVIWAQQHGSPMSWGNKPGDNRVPLDVWKLIASAGKSPDYGPLGPAAWARAADMLGGGILAMQGKKYHPDMVVAEDPAAKKKRLIDLFAPLLGMWGMGGGGIGSL